ncbi:hypothetical protein C7271_09405 [filamentous cyanobacterium CCP5]|nr:hypothetical protein C7271_09405 [filamentous cyanobacterium CCP5]
MSNRLVASALAATACLAVTGALSAPEAQALSFNRANESFTINTSNEDDEGESLLVLFNGFVEETLIPGLTAEALFTVDDIDLVNKLVKLTVEITNTTTISNSRVSILGFDIDPNPTSVTSTGIFNIVASGNPPGNKVGPVEFCFKGAGGPNCNGGGGAGVSKGNTGTFNPEFSYSTLPAEITLSNFFVRYQNVDGTPLGTSGVGVGQVPTPALLPGLIGMGVAALRKKQGETAEEA